MHSFEIFRRFSINITGKGGRSKDIQQEAIPKFKKYHAAIRFPEQILKQFEQSK
jgi:hypothetical protein